MLSDPANLTAQYGAPRGIIQIGAHYGQEYFPYKALGVKNFVMIEAIARHVDEMRSRITDPSVLIYETALGATVKNIEINLSDFSPPPWGLAEGDSLNEYKGMSSSILKPKKHLEENPWIEFKEKATVPMTTLDALIKEKDINLSLYNMLNIDVQGYELEVLKGAENSLGSIKYIYTEVNRDEVYEDCAQVEEIDRFLGDYNFLRVETFFPNKDSTWGDALYLKKIPQEDA